MTGDQTLRRCQRRFDVAGLPRKFAIAHFNGKRFLSLRLVDLSRYVRLRKTTCVIDPTLSTLLIFRRCLADHWVSKGPKRGYAVGVIFDLQEFKVPHGSRPSRRRVCSPSLGDYRG